MSDENQKPEQTPIPESAKAPPVVERRAVRSRLLKTEVVPTIEVEHDGAVVLVRQPNIRILKTTLAIKDSFDQTLRSIIECTYTKAPDGRLGEKVFEVTDLAELQERDLREGGLLGKIVAAMQKLGDADAAQEAAKNG